MLDVRLIVYLKHEPGKILQFFIADSLACSNAQQNGILLKVFAQN